MDDQTHQPRSAHVIDGPGGGMSQPSPFSYHGGGSLAATQEQKMGGGGGGGHFDGSSLTRHQQQQMHQHLAAVSHMQQTAQRLPQMIHMQQAMHLPVMEQSYQYYHSLPNGMLQMPLVEDVSNRPQQQTVVSYPVSAMLISSEQADKNCCLTDRDVRCQRAAGTAGFTHRIQERVKKSHAKLVEDVNAGHHYICDYHKTYIQKLRVMPSSAWTGIPTSSHEGSAPYFPSSFPQFSSPYTVDAIIQQATSSTLLDASHNDFAGENGAERIPTPNRGSTMGSYSTSGGGEGHKRREHVEPASAPVDMRKVHQAEVRNVAVAPSLSPEKESSSDDSEEEYDGGLAASDYMHVLGDMFSLEELKAYVRHFEIDLPPRPTEEELRRMVCEHMDTVQVNDVQATLTSFFHGVKTDTRAFNQPYKQSLSVDFDLSSDEEMTLVDGAKNGGGALNGQSLSPTSEAQSDSDLEEEEEESSAPLDDNIDSLGFAPADFILDADTQRTLQEINGKIPVSEIERILSRYALPTKHSFAAHESDTESSASSGDRKPVKRSVGGLAKKREKMRNNDD
ncbi:hypothetical protein BV898_09444 [Hypsibius exemplaris]|uniref:Histone deacetylase complex subunit SAP30 zinc-finger domain-containing protein n=1 Tax=Hypsibius exemplaris TaxID=2072580 RepID=A0A1W0WML8_HYPEX|nr:hypothetical protein BV898_09444 [Hypsibius exemplaris]